ncbi:MAG: hypothetical protein ACK6DX_17020 [Acidobacteriota bacterium]
MFDGEVDFRRIPLAPACRNRSASASVIDTPHTTALGIGLVGFTAATPISPGRPVANISRSRS